MTDREREFNNILCDLERARDRFIDLSESEIEKVKSIIITANQIVDWDKEFKEELLNEK